MIEISLTWAEASVAAEAGVRRCLHNLRAGRRETHGVAAGGLWSAHVDGALAEMAFAKWAGRYWVPYQSRPTYQGDVTGIEVRTTRHPNGHLLLHEDDPDEMPCVLVIGSVPDYRIAGWVMASEGKQPAFWSTAIPRPAYAIPCRALRPIEELVEKTTTVRMEG